MTDSDRPMEDERARADRYEGSKDNLDEWGDAVPPTRPRRRLASMISVRLTPGEVALVRSAAEKRGLSLSAFLRAAALAEATHGVKPATRASTQTNSIAITFIAEPSGADVATIGGTTKLLLESGSEAIPA